MNKSSNDYSGIGDDFEPFEEISYASISILPFLIGKPWDDFALGWVHSVQPSRIRVTQSGVKLDAWCWRVTVYLGSDGMIYDIEQEVEVGLPNGYRDGHHMLDIACPPEQDD
jgi:hypothetical protein